MLFALPDAFDGSNLLGLSDSAMIASISLAVAGFAIMLGERRIAHAWTKAMCGASTSAAVVKAMRMAVVFGLSPLTVGIMTVGRLTKRARLVGEGGQNAGSRRRRDCCGELPIKIGKGGFDRCRMRFEVINIALRRFIAIRAHVVDRTYPDTAS